MSEKEDYKKVRELMSMNKKEESRKLLWKLFSSKNEKMKLNAVMGLVGGALDPVTQNDKLLEVTEEGLMLSNRIGDIGSYAYLLTRKILFMTMKLSLVIHRQRCLMLSAGVFRWIEFSLVEDKQEYESLSKEREQLEEEIRGLEESILKAVNVSSDTYYRGNIFMELGNYYSSKSLNQKQDLASGGKIRSKIANIYFVRRWNLDKLILLNRKQRRIIKRSKDNFVRFLNMAIAQFKIGKHESEEIRAHFLLAVGYKFMYKFYKSRKCLNKAKSLAEALDDEVFLATLTELEKELKDKN